MSTPEATTATVNTDRLKEILHTVATLLPAATEAVVNHLHELIGGVDSFEDVGEAPVGVPGAAAPVASSTPESDQIIAAIGQLAQSVQSIAQEVETLKQNQTPTAT